MVELKICSSYFDLWPIYVCLYVCKKKCLLEMYDAQAEVQLDIMRVEVFQVQLKSPPPNSSSPKLMFCSFAVVQSLVREASVLSSDQFPTTQPSSVHRPQPRSNSPKIFININRPKIEEEKSSSTSLSSQ